MFLFSGLYTLNLVIHRVLLLACQCKKNMWFCLQETGSVSKWKQEQEYMKDHVSVYLALAHSNSLGPGWDRGAQDPCMLRFPAR